MPSDSSSPPTGPALERLLEKAHVVAATFDADTETVQVYVTSKCPADDLHTSDTIPPTYGGYPTDVIACGLDADADGFEMYTPGPPDPGPPEGVPEPPAPDDQRLLTAADVRYRPLEAGISECHHNGTAGTAAILARVTDTSVATWADSVSEGDIVRLSNHHVYVGTGDLGDPIWQPSPYDGGRDRFDAVGDLAGYVDLEDGVSVDVAARTTSVSDYTDTDIALPTAVADPQDLSGEAVWKRGRTTHHTGGMIADTGVSTRVNFGAYGTLTVSDCLISTDMSAPGDSGSPVFTNDNRLVGLVFAGSAEYTVICTATEIEHRLGVEIFTKENPL